MPTTTTLGRTTKAAPFVPQRTATRLAWVVAPMKLARAMLTAFAVGFFCQIGIDMLQ
ncbi:MAG: hypothetical protein HYS67_01795 [Deltaproteobacteria bacterium]|nr:hypothetical protein [Deltaproteobacteria bacterium]